MAVTLNTETVAKPGLRCWAKRAYEYGAVHLERGQLIVLSGQHNDARLVELGYLVPVREDSSTGRGCSECERVFISQEFVNMHRARVHSAAGATAIAAEARQEQERARFREAGRKELNDIMGAPCPTCGHRVPPPPDAPRAA